MTGAEAVRQIKNIADGFPGAGGGVGGGGRRRQEYGLVLLSDELSDDDVKVGKG